jgi:calcineurin-like phosphoesterase family protein
MGHANIIPFTGRPFMNKGDWNSKDGWLDPKFKKSACHFMNTELTRLWNETVSENDIVYHLGDFSFEKNIEPYTKHLNGHIIHFKGNHDRVDSLESAILVFKDKRFYLTHIPPETNSDIPRNVNAVLCGHVHEKWRINDTFRVPVINVGVDVWNYKPVLLSTILQLLTK